MVNLFKITNIDGSELISYLDVVFVILPESNWLLLSYQNLIKNRSGANITINRNVCVCVCVRVRARARDCFC